MTAVLAADLGSGAALSFNGGFLIAALAATLSTTFAGFGLAVGLALALVVADWVCFLDV
jgi:hypothetical protein